MTIALMPRRIAFSIVILTAASGADMPQSHLVLHGTRWAASDLELTGRIRGLPAGTSAFARYADLLTLPQTAAIITDDPDYPGPPLHVSGISLDTLAHAANASSESDLIDALCADRYRSHFPADYVARHHPLLVLTIEGKRIDVWAKQTHWYDPSPYVVMYQDFVPAFKVLAHSDQPQLPDNIVRINFSTQLETFGALAPRGNFAPGSPEQNGFIIAKQNCLRCHFMGSVGGTKSGRNWTSLGDWANDEPAFFQAYIHNPQKIEPHAHMEGSPQYDAATLQSLTAYFRTFSDHRSGRAVNP